MFTTSQRVALAPGMLRSVHHIAFNVKDIDASRRFYGAFLGLTELTGDAIPSTLKELVAEGKVANFVMPDGTVIDLFWEPDLAPPNADPRQQFTRANHLAFDVAPEQFDQVVDVLHDDRIEVFQHGRMLSPECVVRSRRPSRIAALPGRSVVR